ncbi:RNA polymerase I-specific transcription initiation factor RRN3 family protein [Cytobacillus sp. NCCP-133]|uniref:RNA polymerase I-specific transcription initiation factor RRN3 family protein n=1 Tax=Cytobacillus sp. NCCP-133 TaxID=766848 RepID=UPI00222FBBE0|nr:RNA polymerase I-specific transcription initiation factor RRN3 family protein [Cytobacillus sp. NCCP-133]GLB61665.1 hypothetical protein NCCP133_37940 [Cytobacillus sp. NCCP-133]
MKFNKLLLSVPLSAGLFLAGCGADEQDPPPETEDVELEQNEMEENNTDTEMQDPGTSEDSEMQDPATTEDSEMQDPGMNEETPSGEDGMDGTDQETDMNMNEDSEEN